MRRIIPTCTTFAAILLAVGCTANKVSDVGEGPREAITYSARATYPGNAKQSDQLRSIAMIDSGRDELTIYNLGSRQIPASSVWVNGTFVRRIDSIPPKGNATVRYSQLLEAGAGVNSLAQLDQDPQRVELQTDSGLFSVDGPVEK